MERAENTATFTTIIRSVTAKTNRRCNYFIAIMNKSNQTRASISDNI